MADTKITALAAIATVDPAADVLPIVDISDTSMAASGTTKKVTTNQILQAGGTATLASAAITGAATVGTTLGVTGVSTFAAGTALLPALTTTGDTNTGIYYPAADTFAVTTGGAERYRVDSSGNVGVGVTPSAWASNFKAFELGRVGNAIATYTAAGGAADLYISSNVYYNGGLKYANSSQTAGLYSITGDVHAWFTAASGTAGALITDFATAKMTLDGSGNLLVGTTSAATTSGSGFKVTSPVAGHFDPLVVTSSVSASHSCWDIYSTGGTAGYRFYVTATGTVNAVNPVISAISDARLKENIQDLDVGLAAILALKPRKFDWKAGKGKDIKGDRGFIAQEFETVFPNLIDEWKDAAPEGEAPYKSVRADLIPVLVKAIQELTAEVNALKNA